MKSTSHPIGGQDLGGVLLEFNSEGQLQKEGGGGPHTCSAVRNLAAQERKDI